MGLLSSDDSIPIMVSGIAALRGLFNLSQAELAVLTGVSRATINRLETQNDKFISLATVLTLTKSLEALGAVIAYTQDGGVFVKVSPSALQLGIDLRGMKGSSKLSYLHGAIRGYQESMQHDLADDNTVADIAYLTEMSARLERHILGSASED